MVQETQARRNGSIGPARAYKHRLRFENSGLRRMRKCRGSEPPQSGGRGMGAGATATASVAAGGPMRSPGRRALSGRSASERSGMPDRASTSSGGRAQDLEREPCAGYSHTGFDERREEMSSKWSARLRWDAAGRRNPCSLRLSTGVPILDSTRGVQAPRFVNDVEFSGRPRSGLDHRVPAEHPRSRVVRHDGFKLALQDR